MSRTVSYTVADPTGNITLLVETPVPPSEQPAVAALLMSREPDAEQVGFLSSGDGCDIALRMAGGEFCGNAAMCAAAVYARNLGLGAARVTVRVSGAEASVAADVSAPEHGLRSVRIAMPKPVSVSREKLPDAGSLPVVRFSGICHVILEDKLSPETAEKRAAQWCRALDADALGIMFLDRTEERITPLVYVPVSDTMFWEHSCASGSTAVGAWLAHSASRDISVRLRQPGGILTVQAGPGGSLFLTGSVRLLRETAADIP